MATQINYKNPYLSDKLPKLSSDDFVSGIYEDESLAAQHKYNQMLAAEEYEAALQLMLDEREYNSPQNQVALMRAAGLNPDFQTLPSNTGSPGSFHGSPNSQNVSPKGVSSFNPTQFSLDAAKSFFEVLPQAISAFQSMKINIQQSDLNEMTLMNHADNAARKEIGRQFTLDDLSSSNGIPHVNLDAYSRRNQKRVQDNISRYVDNINHREIAKGIVYDYKSSAESSRQGFLNLLGSFGYNVNDEAFTKVIKTFNDILHDERKAQAKYNKEYYSSADGKLAGESENSSFNKSLVDNNTLSTKLMEKANKLFDSDKFTDKTAGVLLYFITTFMSGNSPITVTKSKKDKQGGYTLGF